MKIDEAVKFINGTNTAFAEVEDGDLIIFEHNRVSDDWFLRFPTKAKTWRSIIDDEDCLTDVEPQDLARVMDVIQRLLDTPVEERFPEKKYRLRWIDDKLGKTFLGFNNQWTEKFWSTYGVPTSNTIFTESELEQLKKDNPRLAPAIDAMKEPAEDKDE
ncbi:hypothetical protein [Limosilactobacillus sp. DJ3M12]|uniref:hypothetical protein n=1 Tax=Limosilactobacillus sp. DJ3M12 TaxID=2991835 RepID=UPI0024BB9B78|nr:hypothetical protein [Limosilactobacillus sp. DJ3M12]